MNKPSSPRASPPLSPSTRHAIQAVAQGLSVSEAARRFGVSRPTIYRWLGRQDTVTKSRKPKSCSPSMLPIQRDAIGELVRLTRRSRMALLPAILQVFPVFRFLTPNGQRRVWDAALGEAGCLPVAARRKVSAAVPYVSRFRVGALWLGDARHPDDRVCCLWAAEEASGLVVHRVVAEDGTLTVVDFLCDLCHEWPFAVSALTLLIDPSGVFPDRAPLDRGRGLQISWERLCAEFRQALAGQSVPDLKAEVLPARPRTLWLRRLKVGRSLLQVARRVVGHCLARHNLWDGSKPATWSGSASAVRPLDELLRRAKSGDVALLRPLAARALVRYSERKRNQAWQRVAYRPTGASTKVVQKNSNR